MKRYKIKDNLDTYIEKAHLSQGINIWQEGELVYIGEKYLKDFKEIINKIIK